VQDDLRPLPNLYSTFYSASDRPRRRREGQFRLQIAVVFGFSLKPILSQELQSPLTQHCGGFIGRYVASFPEIHRG
jgi:hypothetical protein